MPNPFRRVTDQFSVAPQIALSDLATAASLGFGLVISNRPDGEEPAQPSAAVMEAAAKAAGLKFAHIPVVGGPTAAQADDMAALIEGSETPVLAFCRSGTRSITTWSLGQLRAGNQGRDALVDQAAGAGYDLSAALPRAM